MLNISNPKSEQDAQLLAELKERNAGTLKDSGGSKRGPSNDAEAMAFVSEAIFTVAAAVGTKIKTMASVTNDMLNRARTLHGELPDDVRAKFMGEIDDEDLAKFLGSSCIVKDGHVDEATWKRRRLRAAWESLHLISGDSDKTHALASLALLGVNLVGLSLEDLLVAGTDPVGFILANPEVLKKVRLFASFRDADITRAYDMAERALCAYPLVADYLECDGEPKRLAKFVAKHYYEPTIASYEYKVACAAYFDELTSAAQRVTYLTELLRHLERLQQRTGVHVLTNAETVIEVSRYDGSGLSFAGQPDELLGRALATLKEATGRVSAVTAPKASMTAMAALDGEAAPRERRAAAPEQRARHEPAAQEARPRVAPEQQARHEPAAQEARPRRTPRGVCFVCEEQGHHARECPAAKKAKQMLASKN